MRLASLGLILAITLSGCASQTYQQRADTAAQKMLAKHDDPYESFNRDMWHFDWDILDKHVLRPATVVYVDYTPQFARTGLYNFAQNLDEPGNVINNLLEGKFKDSFASLFRFVLNSTVGLLGTIDVASEGGVKRRDESFNEVLAVWGVNSGPYVVLPALGPSDVRDTSTRAVEGFYFPIQNLNIYVTLTKVLIKGLETRASLMDKEKLVNDAVDPYSMVKNIYFQNQAYKISDGKLKPKKPTKEEKKLDQDIDDYLNSL